jgi:hypothetical protein
MMNQVPGAGAAGENKIKEESCFFPCHTRGVQIRSAEEGNR